MRNVEKAFVILNARYVVGFSQQIVGQLETLDRCEINLFDILAINEVANEIRQEIKGLFGLYRSAYSVCKSDGQLMHRVYANHKTILLRRQISDLWRVYLMARADSRELTAEYMRRLEMSSYKASLPTVNEYRDVA